MIDGDDVFGIERQALIDQAQGVLASRYRISIDDAAQLLRIDALTLARPVREIAADVIGAETHGPDADCPWADAARNRGWHECGGASD